MQVGQPSQDALVSFSDFLLEKFGLVASMQVAVVASIAFHTIAIVGLGFNLPRMMREAAPHNIMDVVLVNSKSFAKPTKADALAQANLDGGGNTDKKMRASTPFPMADPRQPSPELKASEERRKQFIGARTEEYRFATYIDRWRVKVERIGTMNYPQEARAKGIHASLQLTVGIKRDGEIESVEINRRSGHRFLDDAARRIVRMAAPFEPFPQDIRADTDILYITRTYTFTRADRAIEITAPE